MNKKNEQKKFREIDYIDIFSNNFSRLKKHLFWPAVLGLVAGIIAVYFASSLHLFNLNNKYFLLFWKAFWASSFLRDTFFCCGHEFPTQKALHYAEQKVLDNISVILLIFTTVFVSVMAAVYFGIAKLAKKTTKKILEEEILQGSKILEEKELIELQKKDKVEGAPVGHRGAKFAKNFENQHCFISGASGTGKTILMRRMYVYYKQNRPTAKFLLHDVKGDYVQKFYNPETDFIFNFSDARTFNFNFFKYLKTQTDVKSFVASVIPSPAQEKDPIWTNSARAILEGIILYCIQNNKKTNKDVKELINLPYTKLGKLLSETKGAEDGAAFLTSGSEEQIGNFYSNFKSKVIYFTSMPEEIDKQKELNIEKWLTDLTTQSTIFLLNDTKNKDLNAIRISVFLNVLIKTFLSLEESKQREIFFLLDEFGSLQKMDSIVDLLALGRSFGAKVFIGIQEIQRLYAIYGKDLTSTIVNNTSSKIILRANEYETAEYCAKLVGEVKKKETNLTNTTGADLNSNREGASFANITKTEKAILAADLMQLENNTYMYKNGTYPWTKIETTFIKEIDEFENINKAFVEREDILLSKIYKTEKEKEEEIANEIEQPKEEETTLMNKEMQEKIEQKYKKKKTKKKTKFGNSSFSFFRKNSL